MTPRVICFLAIFFMMAKLFSCSKHTTQENISTAESKDTIPFLEREIAGTLENKNIDEASGITSSYTFPGYLWTHNDSGDKARLFLIKNDGKQVSEVKINGAINRDWEDVATGFDPFLQKNYILIADIGDNDAKYFSVNVYKVLEPDFLPKQDTTISVYKKWIIKYPDGQRDAETLMIDPWTQDIYILSKRDPQIFVYRIGFPYPESDTITAEKTATLPFTQLVAGDISKDGSEILIKNYDLIYYFKRQSTETVTQALQKKPVMLPYIREPQGEALCFSGDATSFYTVSEKTSSGITPVLYRYRRK